MNLPIPPVSLLLKDILPCNRNNHGNVSFFQNRAKHATETSGLCFLQQRSSNSHHVGFPLTLPQSAPSGVDEGRLVTGNCPHACLPSPYMSTMSEGGLASIHAWNLPVLWPPGGLFTRAPFTKGAR